MHPLLAVSVMRWGKACRTAGRKVQRSRAKRKPVYLIFPTSSLSPLVMSLETTMLSPEHIG